MTRRSRMPVQRVSKPNLVAGIVKSIAVNNADPLPTSTFLDLMPSDRHGLEKVGAVMMRRKSVREWGDQNLIAYIKGMPGYPLTGSVQEHALFFCHGTGRNGKGVLRNHGPVFGMSMRKFDGGSNLISFCVTISAAQRDLHLAEK